MKKYTIEELEARSGEKLLEVMQDYFDSCIRTGNTNRSQNIAYFMRENELEQGEFYKVAEAYDQIEEGVL